MSSLHELYLVSGIICKSGVTEDAFSDEETRFEDVMKLKAPLSRIQRLMLALLPKYSVRENWDRVSYLVILCCSINKIQSLRRLHIASATCNPISGMEIAKNDQLLAILGFQSIRWDLHDKDSAAMLEEKKLQKQ